MAFTPKQRHEYYIKNRSRLLAQCADYRRTHRREKSEQGRRYYQENKSVATLAVSSSLQKIKEEIVKCELVCSNCHQLRTFMKKQYKRAI